MNDTLLSPADYIINQKTTVRDAMLQITFNRHGCVVVVDDLDHVVGVLSDGDIRRALLTGALMITPINKIMNINVFYLDEADNFDKVYSLFKKYRGILILPVLKGNRSIAGVYLREKFID